MGHWIRGIAIALIVQGILDLLAGLAWFAILGTGAFAEPGQRTDPTGLAVAIGIGAVLVGFGVLRLWGGLLNRRYRARTLGLVAHGVGFIDPVTWSCSLLLVVIPVLGLVAYLGQEGKQAFEWGASGRSPEEIRGALAELRASKPADRGGQRTLMIVLIAVIGVPFVIAMVGVMTALAIYGVRKYVVNAKRSEGQTVAAELARGIARCATQRGHLPPSSAPVPADLAQVRGMKYQSAPRDWTDEAFACAGFAPTDPQYYQYQWVKQSDSSGVVQAIADLDGDGEADREHQVGVACEHGQCSVGASGLAGSAL
jgi:type IV pilus assembly protein PilA